MRTTLRAAVMLAAAALLIPVSSVTASAVVDNDVPGDAIAVALDTMYSMDSRPAETEPLDAVLNNNCGAPAVLGSVWYSYTSDGTEGPGILVDGTASNYDLGLMIFAGDPTAGGELVYCGPLQAAAMTTVGQTYYVMAFTANSVDPVGGDLVLTFSSAPPSPTISVTVDPRGTAFKDGSARITGTYSCTDAEYGDFSGSVTQRVGRLKIVGDFYFTDSNCDGETHPWEAFANSYNGYFSGGKAAQVTYAFVCGALECADGYAEATIQLSRGKK